MWRINAIYHLEMFPRGDAEKRNVRERRDVASAGRIKKNREREDEQVGRRKGVRRGGQKGLGPVGFAAGMVLFLLSSGARDISLYPD